MNEPRFYQPRFLHLLAVMFCLNVVGAQILHEAGHWLVLTTTGRQPVWSLTAIVQLSDREPQQPADWTVFAMPGGEDNWLHMSSLPASTAEWVVFIAAGPLAQVLAVGVGLYLALRSASIRWRTFGLLLALINGFGHFFYQLVSSLRSGGGGDETLLGYYTGIPWPLIALIFGGLAGAGMIYCFRLLPAGSRGRWLGALFLGTIPVGPFFMIFHGMIIDGVDAGAAFYTPVLGWSLPVLLLGLGTGAVVYALSRGWDVNPPPTPP